MVLIFWSSKKVSFVFAGFNIIQSALPLVSMMLNHFGFAIFIDYFSPISTIRIGGSSPASLVCPRVIEIRIWQSIVHSVCLSSFLIKSTLLGITWNLSGATRPVDPMCHCLIAIQKSGWNFHLWHLVDLKYFDGDRAFPGFSTIFPSETFYPRIVLSTIEPWIFKKLLSCTYTI